MLKRRAGLRSRRRKAGRLPRDRFAGLPLAPKMRIVDPGAIQAARKPFCEWCRTRVGPFEVHHISARGMGGAKGDDVPENLVNLCAGARPDTCHDNTHRGHSPTPDELRLIAQARQAERCGI